MLLSVQDFLKEARDDFQPDMFRHAMHLFMGKGPHSQDINSIVAGDFILMMDLDARTFSTEFLKEEEKEVLKNSFDYHGVPAIDVVRYYMH